MPKQTSSWLVTMFRKDRTQYELRVGYSIVTRPIEWAAAHVRLDLLGSVINTCMGVKRRPDIYNKIRAQYALDNLVIHVTELRRCKSWKRYTGQRWPRCTDCTYCRALFVVKHQQEILNGE